MKHCTRILGVGILLLAVAVAGCKTTPPTGRGKLCIDVYGKGARNASAQVFINGTKECDASMARGRGFFLFCPAGKHTVKVECTGFETYEKEAKVHRNQTTWMNIRLKPPKPEKEKPAEKPAES